MFDKKMGRYASGYALEFAVFSLLCAALALVFLIGGIRLAPLTPSAATDADSLEGSGVTFVIDAGHGGEDGGTVGGGLVEKDLNLDIALTLARLLEDAGAEVVLTRSTDTMLYDKNSDHEGKKKALDLRARKDITEACEEPVFVSIHMNYFPQTQYSGLQVYYSGNDPRSAILAKMIQDECRASLQPNNARGTKEATSSIFLLYNLRCPAVLVECGFLSNPAEARLLSTKEHRDAIARVIFLALEEYILQNKP